jgi:hypothetical protein
MGNADGFSKVDSTALWRTKLNDSGSKSSSKSQKCFRKRDEANAFAPESFNRKIDSLSILFKGVIGSKSPSLEGLQKRSVKNNISTRIQQAFKAFFTASLKFSYECSYKTL